MNRPWTAAIATLIALAAPTFAVAAELYVVTVRHEVTNFDAWKKGFDADESSRQKAGIQTLYVLRDADKPSIVTVVHETANLDKLRTFMGDPSLKEKMKKAGVRGAPDVKIGLAVQARGSK